MENNFEHKAGKSEGFMQDEVVGVGREATDHVMEA